MAYYMCLDMRPASQVVVQLLCFHTITTGRTIILFVTRQIAPVAPYYVLIVNYMF